MKRWRAWLASLARWAWRRLARPPTRRAGSTTEHAVPGATCAVLRRGPPPAVTLAGEAGAILAAHHARLRDPGAYAPLARLAARHGVVIHARVDAGSEGALFIVAAPTPPAGPSRAACAPRSTARVRLTGCGGDGNG